MADESSDDEEPDARDWWRNEATYKQECSVNGCKVVLEGEAAHRAHVAEAHPGKTLSICPEAKLGRNCCSQVFFTAQPKYHREGHAGLECKWCAAPFTKKLNLNRHEAVCQGLDADGNKIPETKQPCEMCGELMTAEGRRRHEKTCKGKDADGNKIPQERYPCDKCDKMFTLATLTSHRTKSKCSGRTFTCDHVDDVGKVCGASFNDVRKLSSHVDIVHKLNVCQGVDEDGERCWSQRCTSGDTRYCIRHGGGLRCIGSDAFDKGHEPCSMNVALWDGKSRRYGDRCVRCFIRTDPNHPLSRIAAKYLMVREQTVVDVLKEAFPNYYWVLNRHLQSGRQYAKGTLIVRPDMRARRGRRIIIVEIDEKSHEHYECAKERKREVEMVRAAGDNTRADDDKQLSLIRFNPDEYKDYVTGALIPGCFKYVQPKKEEEEAHEAKYGKRNYPPHWYTTSLDPAQSEQWEDRCAQLIHAVSVLTDPDHDDYLEVIPPPEKGRDVFTVEICYDDVRGFSDAQKRKALARKKAMGKARAKATKEAQAAGSSTDHAKRKREEPSLVVA